ncbi:dirigent protein 2-like [Oryza sativa Japonica Group]|uniref:Dirigent protein n=4 Tax=Oryza TaxID=4527 RepID=A0A8J8Y504_ORYSJ|nr:uncharacterized protein LOC107279766 [Oryza sativa Japonica Group]ABA98069.1 dirigent protein, putative, expressed [Oryza sativa Japonica Group]EAZ20385.1 hypothetical protein OsJ_35994 [Oryza sativa Japonica Group]KAF2907709.1 hypothetical protein DAI22_12g118700 [Oryza sativa Japonica Group]
MGSLCGTMIIILAMLPAILTMADPYCDCDCPQQCEVKLHYYLHQFRAGANHPNRNEEFVTSGGPSGLGAGLIHDWSLTTGLDPNVNIVGRAQGWHIVASQSSPANWYLSQNIVFQDSKYAGSTLQVMGIIEGSEEKVGEWSIVGGTGEFTNARGNIKYRAIKKEDVEWIRELDIQVFYTPNTPSDVQVAKNITKGN